MLDNEPDNNDHNDSARTGAESAPSSPPPRRRRAATRKAGPPSVGAELPPGQAQPGETHPDQTQADHAQPAMTAESAPVHEPVSTDPQTPAEESSDESAKKAKKATRKRATKATEGGTRAPRKRTSKKAASPDADESRRSSDAAGEVAPESVAADGQPAEKSEVMEGVDQRAADVPRSDDQPQQLDEPIEAADSGPADQAPAPDAEPNPDAESALDQIRLALSAELPPPAPIEDGDGAENGDQAWAPTGSDEHEAADSAGLDDDEDSDESDDESEDSDDANDESADEASAGEDDEEGGAQRRRRRRRGARRRRRGGGGSEPDDANRSGGQERQDGSAAEAGSGDSAEPIASGAQDAPDDTADRGTDSGDDKARDGDEQAAEQPGDDADDDGGQRRRRRRRRRRGEDSGPAADDPAEVVVRVREPRSRKQAAQEVTGIEGSTRMEAKRQRRREGREAGRRRAPILSEAEFLARREAVVRKMVIRQREELSQIAVLEDDILVEHYVDRESAASLIGNVYLGRVQNVLPSMEAAFIDIGRGRNAVLYAGEVDWDAFGANGQQRKVENVLKSGQTVLVQVTKDPVGAKGARLTSHVTLPGRYIVYAPGGHLSGISRKLPDNERKRLKSILNDLVPESASVIVRTAAEGASEDELTRDVSRLKDQWEDIERKVKAGSAPKLLYGEPDLTVRIVRDLFTEDFAELIIQGNGSQTDAYEAVDAYVGHVAPHLHDRMRRWDAEAQGDLFAKFRLDEQISKALERKVFLPSGGSLIIDRTEAMTVIDVNTGKFTGSGGNLEATVTSNNLEAAEEIVRQLRLRDIGGIIVIDFIDMVLPSNRELLLRRLVECLGRDRTRHQVAEVTSLGLVQMTRKKIGTGLLEAFTTECEQCHGRGYEISDVPVETQKQPDGGSRDQRGGGGGGGRGRGRGNQSGSGSNGNQRPQHQPIPAALRPDRGPKPEPTTSESAAAEPADVPPTEAHPTEDLPTDAHPTEDLPTDAPQQPEQQSVSEQLSESTSEPETAPAT